MTDDRRQRGIVLVLVLVLVLDSSCAGFLAAKHDSG